MSNIQQQIVEELTRSYFMEVETVMNYIANSTNLVGVKAEPIKQSLLADVAEEIGHAQMIAKRIHILGGAVPGSMDFKAAQKSLQPPSDDCDVISVIRGVIDAEGGAVVQYKKIIGLCAEASDPVTEDMCVTLLADEEEHKREFEGFLQEYEREM
jgi:bacterioferritin